MARYQVIKGELVYSSPEAGVTVRKGIITPQNYSVAIKELISADFAGANGTIREAVAMAYLQHAGICQIYDCYLDQNELGQFVAVIIVEGMDSDLWVEIQRRKNCGQPWADAELLDALRQMATALGFAQIQGIAHRDIKPQNIFVTGNVYKIGDFGSSSKRLYGSDVATTIRGSPFFLSPELKTSFRQALQEVPYDPFKSDVYSLGLSLLCMAMLDAPREMNNLENLETTTTAYLDSLVGYPETQSCLRSMLVVDPNGRPSFAEVQSYIEGRFSASAAYIVPGYQQAPAPGPVCETCRQTYQSNPQFPDSPYCSVACYERSHGTRVCSICSKPILSTSWVHSISRDLSAYQAFASDVCSEDCLRSFRSMSGGDSTQEKLRETVKPLLKDASKMVMEAAEDKVPGSGKLLKQAFSMAKSFLD